MAEAPMPTQHTETTAETRRFKVFRFKRGGHDGERFDEFVVPVGPHTTVLDALLWIQLHRDRTLALRHSCMHASCGTCGVLVNRREALACVTSVSDLGDEVTVEPLANIPVLTDLVVDMDELYARFYADHPLVRASELPAGADTPEGLAEYLRFEDCLECGLCLSACPIASTSQEYVGPAALIAAQRLLEEPRGADEQAVLDWAAGPQGVWRCHAAYECTEACPANVNPAERIMALRRELLRAPSSSGRGS
jgi:succinate dehydrogenase iron-sulfur subunit